MARAADPILARSAACSVVSRLRDAGHIAYFAGGCVRDELLGLCPTDYDVATDAVPDRVASIFDRTMLVGVAFGVVLVHIPPPSLPSHAGRPSPGASVEVATFRSDGPYSDARRPDRIHFSDPRSDAQRRDFTINALFLDPLAPPDPSLQLLPTPHAGATKVRGRVIDHVGGLDDLRAGLVRAVGDPEQRLAEDHLRALRAVRFAARLGFEIHPATAHAISRHASELRGVSRERIGEEVRRMFLHPSRAVATALLQTLQLDAPVLDGPHLTAPLPTLAGLQEPATDASAAPPYPTSLAAWALDRADAMPDPAISTLAAPPARGRRARSMAEGLVGKWRSALRLSNDERDQLAAILSGYATLVSTWQTSGEAAQKRMAAQPWFSQALRLLHVREPTAGRRIDARVAELHASSSGVAPEPLITGDDLIQMGIAPGPLFKRIIDAVYDAQLEGRIRSKSEARELARVLCV